MFKVIHSKFIKLLLVGSIISASIPSTKIDANWFWPKSKKQTAFTLLAGAAIFCAAAFGIWHFIIKPRQKKSGPVKPTTPVINVNPELSSSQLHETKSVENQKKIVGKKETVIPLANQPTNIYTFDQWKDKCDKLPAYRENNYSNTALTKDEFIDTIVKFTETLKNQLSEKNNWIHKQARFSDEDFNIEKVSPDNNINIEKFYVQKLNLPKDSKIFKHADIHGDVHSLIKYLSELKKDGVIDNNFKIKENNYLAFLGDYTDRGCYGVEVLYTIMKLKIANPDNVIMLRGNHEDLAINVQYGLGTEITEKFKDSENLDINYFYYLLTKLYNLLPCATFTCILSENTTDEKEYDILCHAGIEPRFDPKPLLSANGDCFFQTLNLNTWVGDKTKNSLSKNLQEKTSAIACIDIGFLWHDFKNDKAESSCFNYSRDAGIITSYEDTLNYLTECSSKKDGFTVNRIFKGHEHSDPMLSNMVKFDGVYNICADAKDQWDGKSKEIYLETRKSPVWIFNVCPDSKYGRANGYTFDHYSVLKRSQSGKLCLEPHKVEVFDANKKLII